MVSRSGGSKRKAGGHKGSILVQWLAGTSFKRKAGCLEDRARETNASEPLLAGSGVLDGCNTMPNNRRPASPTHMPGNQRRPLY